MFFKLFDISTIAFQVFPRKITLHHFCHYFLLHLYLKTLIITLIFGLGNTFKKFVIIIKSIKNECKKLKHLLEVPYSLLNQ